MRYRYDHLKWIITIILFLNSVACISVYGDDIAVYLDEFDFSPIAVLSDSYCRNSSFDGTPMKLNGVSCDHGLAVKISTAIDFELSGRSGTLVGTAGVDDSAGTRPRRAEFFIKSREKILWRSGAFTHFPNFSISVFTIRSPSGPGARKTITVSICLTRLVIRFCSIAIRPFPPWTRFPGGNATGK